MDSTAPDWVPESAIGKWFLGTDTWLRFVLTQAIAELRDLATAPPAGRVRLLDVGCGCGAAFAELQRTFAPADIVGVDIDPQMLVAATPRAAQCACPVRLQRGSVTRLDLPNESVDMIFCHQLIHHVANQRAALAELYRVLAPGGMLLMGESCEVFINTWTIRWLFNHPREVQKSAEGYLDLVREAGFVFSDADVRTSTPWWSLPDLGIARRLTNAGGLGRAGEPTAATELFLVARKGTTDGSGKPQDR